MVNAVIKKSPGSGGRYAAGLFAGSLELEFGNVTRRKRCGLTVLARAEFYAQLP